MPQITLVYGKGTIFTGQRFASELLGEGLKQRGWTVEVITPLLLERTQKMSRLQKLKHLIEIFGNLFQSWSRLNKALRRGNPVYINLGQTKYALIRDGLPLVWTRQIKASQPPVVISLHGSQFMDWTADSLETKLFRRMGQAAKTITVLGNTQKEHLLNLGIPEEKLIHVDNTSLIPTSSWSTIWEKHKEQNPLKILFLSNLIETKGYPEFVESLAYLTQEPQQKKIEAILCGKLIDMASDSRFASRDAAEQWLESKIEQINRSDSVRLKWVRGAFGEDKNKLFDWAHIFVLPSRYKTEAQPISILEALASGCAVVTSKVGEIPSTVSENTAVLLDDPTPQAIANALTNLADLETRADMAQAGHKLYSDRFSYEKHIDQWTKILQP